MSFTPRVSQLVVAIDILVLWSRRVVSGRDWNWRWSRLRSRHHHVRRAFHDPTCSLRRVVEAGRRSDGQIVLVRTYGCF